MKTTRFLMAAIAAAAALGAAPAMAASIANGTLSFGGTSSASVDLTASPNTYTASNLGTFNYSGTGSFANSNGQNGQMNGTLDFSSVVGTTITEPRNNFFVFSDGGSGSFKFSVASVTTQTYVSDAASATIGLYLLGTTLDTGMSNLTATPTSLTLQFNRTGNSAFSESGSLSVPPTISAAPEPGTWTLMFAGVGMAGLALRRRKQAVSPLAA